MATADRLTSLGFTRARRLLLLAGLLLLGVLVLVLWARSADEVEVLATLLYAPIVVAFLFLGIPGGLVAGLFATAAYVVLRADAVDVVGADEFAGLIASRGIAYVLFGVAGGWAASTLELSLDKLERVDEIDDQTGLGNARALRRSLDLEQARSGRYGTVFSASVIEIPAAAFGSLGGRRRRAALRALGEEVRAGVRTVDRVAHHADGRRHHVVALLPETDAAGAGVFHDRFLARITGVLGELGIDEPRVTGRACTVPGDEAVLESLLAWWPALDDPRAAPVPGRADAPTGQARPGQ